MEKYCVCPLIGTEKECAIDGVLCSTRKLIEQLGSKEGLLIEEVDIVWQSPAQESIRTYNIADPDGDYSDWRVKEIRAHLKAT